MCPGIAESGKHLSVNSYSYFLFLAAYSKIRSSIYNCSRRSRQKYLIVVGRQKYLSKEYDWLRLFYITVSLLQICQKYFIVLVHIEYAERELGVFLLIILIRWSAETWAILGDFHILDLK